MELDVELHEMSKVYLKDVAYKTLFIKRLFRGMT